MTRTMWTNAHDTTCRVQPGPGRWYRCTRCKTRYRAIGKWVRLRTLPCPGCAATAKKGAAA